MYILHQNIIGNLQIHMAEVPHALYAPFCQIICNLHRLRTRKGKNGNIHGVIFDILLHLVDIINLDTANSHPNQTGIDIEDCLDDETTLLKIGIVHQSLSDIAAANDNHIIQSIQT